MTAIVPLWLAVVGAAAAVFATGYIAGRFPRRPAATAFATVFVGLWIVTTYAVLWDMGDLYGASPDRLAAAALLGAMLTAVGCAVLFVVLTPESDTAPDLEDGEADDWDGDQA